MKGQVLNICMHLNKKRSGLIMPERFSIINLLFLFWHPLIRIAWLRLHNGICTS